LRPGYLGLRFETPPAVTTMRVSDLEARDGSGLGTNSCWGLTVALAHLSDAGSPVSAVGYRFSAGGVKRMRRTLTKSELDALRPGPFVGEAHLQEILRRGKRFGRPASAATYLPLSGSAGSGLAWPVDDLRAWLSSVRRCDMAGFTKLFSSIVTCPGERPLLAEAVEAYERVLASARVPARGGHELTLPRRPKGTPSARTARVSGTLSTSASS
jgi:hypothetical protein